MTTTKQQLIEQAALQIAETHEAIIKGDITSDVAIIGLFDNNAQLLELCDIADGFELLIGDFDFPESDEPEPEPEKTTDFRQLGINPMMDKLADKHGLQHWSCVSPRGNAMWVRRDGHEWYYWASDISRSWVYLLKEEDIKFPVSDKRWQKQ